MFANVTNRSSTLSENCFRKAVINDIAINNDVDFLFKTATKCDQAAFSEL